MAAALQLAQCCLNCRKKVKLFNPDYEKFILDWLEMRNKASVIFVAVVIVSLLFCSSGKRLRFYQPVQQNLIGIKQLVVAPCDGSEDSALICSNLTSIIKQVDYFALFDQNEFTAVLQQQQLSYEDIKQADSLLQIGVLLDLDGIIFADLKSVEIFPDEQGVATEEKSVWTGEYERDPNGNIIEEISETGERVKKKKYKLQKVDQPYRIRKAKMQAAFSLINLKKGGLLVSRELTEDYSSSKIITDEFQQYPSDEEIKSILARQIVNKFFYDFAPKNILVKRAVEKGTALIDSGVVHARAGNWKQAQQFWNQAQKNQPTDARVYYNLGIASEAMGDYDLAASYYKKATLLNPKKKLYQTAFENLKKVGLKK